MIQTSFDQRHEILRPRLNRHFDSIIQNDLVVVHAGGGFGKTWATAAYLAQTEFRSAWFSMTGLDNIPARFWSHFTAAVRRHKPKLADKMERLGFPETSPAFEVFLTEFTGELYQDQQFVVLVFDDIHRITEPLIQKFLAGLINARMENISILLLTREWPLGGLNSEVTPQIVGSRELRFTAEETYELLAGLEITSEEAGRIQRYVSGWPIALSAAAQHLYHHQPLEENQLPFSYTKPLLFQLFEAELFSAYSQKEQTLLIKLSVLETFPRGLVIAVSGEKHKDICQLLAGNIFIKYDGETERFYFHPLYQEFLKEKHLDLGEMEITEAYEKAAKWCREQGHCFDAVNYYRRCGRYEQIWETLKSFHAGCRRSSSEADFFIREIKALPEAFKQREPMTRIVLAVLLANNLRFLEARQMIGEVCAELECMNAEHHHPELLGECYAAMGLIALGSESMGFKTSFQAADRLLPDGSRRWGTSLRLLEFGPGLKLQSAAAGALAESVTVFDESIPCITRVFHGAGQGLDSLCRCEALFLTGHVKAALEPAYQALYAAKGAEQYDVVGSALFMLLRIYTSKGDYGNVKDVLQQIGFYEQDQRSANLGIWEIVRGWFYMEMEAPERVAGWICNEVQHGYPPLSMEWPQLLRLRCLITEGRMAEAMAQLEQFESLCAGKQAVIGLIYSKLARAIIHHCADRIEEAAEALTAAYRLAAGNQIVMPFIEYGSRMRNLIEHIRSVGRTELPEEWMDQIQGRANTFAKRHTYLLACYRQEKDNHQTDFGLSRRERELLNYLSRGLTREEIAVCMEISLNTVKSMMKQIFAKMGAVNSVDVVRIALINRLI